MESFTFNECDGCTHLHENSVEQLTENCFKCRRMYQTETKYEDRYEKEDE